MAEAATYTRLKEDMKEAMRARESERTQTIRMLISSLKNKQIELLRELTEEDITDVFATEAKKRREAAVSYQEGGRQELADKELRELDVISGYLPEQLTDEEVGQMVDAIIAEVGATSKRDMGKVMGPLMPRLKGRYEGSKVKDLVMARLP